jgi:hypothetical protein
MPEAVCGPRGLPDPDGSGRLTFFRFGALTDIGASDSSSFAFGSDIRKFYPQEFNSVL